MTSSEYDILHKVTVVILDAKGKYGKLHYLFSSKVVAQEFVAKIGKRLGEVTAGNEKIVDVVYSEYGDMTFRSATATERVFNHVLGISK